MNDNCLIAEIEGYASIFNTPDLNGDIVAPGAFSKTLRAPGAVRMLYQHAAETPVGRWTSLRQDGRGLYVTGALLLSSQRAREVHALLEGGAIDGLSIGYQTRRAQKMKAGRRITEAELWEVSIVTFPMAPAARIARIGRPRPAIPAQDARVAFTPPARAGASLRPSQSGPDARSLADALRSAAGILSV